MIEIDISAWAILLIVGLCALLEDAIALGLILPAETVVLAAAAAASADAVNVWAVFAVAWLGGTTGDFIGF